MGGEPDMPRGNTSMSSEEVSTRRSRGCQLTGAARCRMWTTGQGEKGAPAEWDGSKEERGVTHRESTRNKGQSVSHGYRDGERRSLVLDGNQRHWFVLVGFRTDRGL